MRHRLSVLALAVAATAALLAACGRSTEVSSGTPGYEDEDTRIDTSSPFTIARPTTTEGATTIPGADPTLPMPDVFKKTTTTTTDDDSVATPTTNPMGDIAVPAASTPTCDAFFKVAVAGRDVQLRFTNDPNSSFDAARDRLVQGLNEALNTLTPRVGEGPDPETAVALRDRILSMRAIAEGAVTLEEAGGVFYPLQTPRIAGEAAGWPEILSHLTRYCASVPRSFGVGG